LKGRKKAKRSANKERKNSLSQGGVSKKTGGHIDVKGKGRQKQVKSRTGKTGLTGEKIVSRKKQVTRFGNPDNRETKKEAVHPRGGREEKICESVGGGGDITTLG